MSIDWITVAAQIANFLVLIWLLKRFLYRPILNGIDAREAEITNRMNAAVEAKEQATAREAEFHEKTRRLNVSQSEMSETIRRSAEDQRDALLSEARQKMECQEADWQSHLDDEARKYTERLNHIGADALLSLTRKALTDLADDTFEDRMAQHLISKIKPVVDDLKRAAGEAKGASVSSREPLTKAIEGRLSSDLKALFPEINVTFTADNTQSVGLVLRMGGAQLAWTVDSYLDGLAEMMSQHLAAGARLKEGRDAV
jgi:F-type H+-transporting ATPase subunit b